MVRNSEIMPQVDPDALSQLVAYVHGLEAQRDDFADTIAAYRSIIKEELDDEVRAERIRIAAEALLSIDDLEEIQKNHSLEDHPVFGADPFIDYFISPGTEPENDPGLADVLASGRPVSMGDLAAMLDAGGAFDPGDGQRAVAVQVEQDEYVIYVEIGHVHLEAVVEEDNEAVYED